MQKENIIIVLLCIVIVGLVAVLYFEKPPVQKMCSWDEIAKVANNSQFCAFYNKDDEKKAEFGLKLYNCLDEDKCESLLAYDDFSGTDGELLQSPDFGDEWFVPDGQFRDQQYEGCEYSNMHGQSILCGDTRWNAIKLDNSAQITCKVSTYITKPGDASAWMYGAHGVRGTETWYIAAYEGFWKIAKGVTYVSTDVPATPNTWWDLTVTHDPAEVNCTYIIRNQKTNQSWERKDFGCHSAKGSSNTDVVLLADLIAGDSSIAYYSNFSCWRGTAQDMPNI